ncbi:hypothetical protein HHI36_014805 [Cryptolaemus montrouzieri]|uniref:Uncharacterized protein n=1 Tax=Cryptolaemus montrouzieri TaxID=559131 RepID=A0ABD2N4J7_9CUCU
MGTVRDIGPEMTENDIISMGKGMKPEVNIIGVRRFNRRLFNPDELDVCKNETECLYCKQCHSAKDRLCPEYMRQQKIWEIMALYNISLFEVDKASQNKLPPISSEYPNLHKNYDASPNVNQVNTMPSSRNKSYANALNHSPKKISVNMPQKRKLPFSPGYNQDEHKCLIHFYPNYPGRAALSSNVTPSSTEITVVEAIIHNQDPPMEI